jgi:hypothetical protein
VKVEFRAEAERPVGNVSTMVPERQIEGEGGGNPAYTTLRDITGARLGKA